MMGKTLELVVTKEPKYWEVNFFGNLDSYSLKEKRKEIMDIVEKVDKDYLVFSFLNLIFINSECISMLVQIHEILEKNGKRLVIVGAKKNVVDVLEVIGLFEAIPYFKTLPEFIKSLENVN